MICCLSESPSVSVPYHFYQISLLYQRAHNSTAILSRNIREALQVDRCITNLLAVDVRTIRWPSSAFVARHHGYPLKPPENLKYPPNLS